MSRDEIKKTLEKQLQLLSERSELAKDSHAGYAELSQLTEAMLNVARFLSRDPSQ